MNKGVKQVRKSIIERKKKRGISTDSKGVTTKQGIPLPQDEEKHGYYPSFFESSGESTQKSRLISGFVLKGILSVMLFFGVALLWESDLEMLSQPKEWTSSALTDEFPFANVYKWYQDTFGNPLAFSPSQNLVSEGVAPLAYPVNGNVTETFQANGKGIMIAPGETTNVSALSEGIVIFSGNDRTTNKTVVVQHADGSKSTYGYLSDIDVHLYQYVATNQRIGQFSPTTENQTVYFSIEKDNQYIDPVQVIKVDDNP
ncbi:peptidoglycan DD-metalloendopeptidase family protein [Ornithinibacillus sp. L9]|uniref:Peptidoglycan DD-metalloendopeptidase family protein n=1 Tax=Ornithinibacillus caprae TaxID=2678566 RepID=A0A6N8FI34_9BACI|nr:M23 family metallopeptidase [Ornithinibacillus caprae]MUK86978.1 peptidoglycan DD-metalloendopeptidase family protein [Ornithinibacillus caprae]